VMLHTTFTSVSVVPPFSPPWTFVVRSGLKPNSQTVATPVPDPTWTETRPLDVLTETGVAPSLAIAAAMVAWSDPTNCALPSTTASGV